MTPSPAAARLAPELRLVLACSRPRMEEADEQQAAAAVDAGLDWDRVVTLAEAHGLLPLFYEQAVAGSVPIPADRFGALRARASRHACHSLKLAAEMAALLNLCATHEIDAVPLKGPVLAQTVYGSVSRRQFRDLDLLIRAVDMPRTLELLTARGYLMELEPEVWARRTTHHVAGVHARSGIRVEVHHQLVMPRAGLRWGYEEVEPGLACSSFGGSQVSTLGEDDQILYLCEHGAGHAWSRLEWIVTIAEIARRLRDWDPIWSRAAQRGATRRLHAMFRLASDLAGAPALSSPFASEDRPTERANHRVVRRLLRTPDRIHASAFESLRYLVDTETTTLRRLGRTARTLLLPTADDGVFARLPRALWPGYYLLRPVRLFRQRVLRTRYRSTP